MEAYTILILVVLATAVCAEVPCGQGMYLMEGKCVPCDYGQYQDETGKEECKPCEDGKTTYQIYSNSSDDCKEICKAGNYFDEDENKCRPCDRNFYQHEDGKNFCYPCEKENMTVREVSESHADSKAGSPPRFKLRPVPYVLALVDGSHTFQCEVTGSPKPVLWWYLNGIELMDQNEKVKIGNYSMLISNLKKSDSGNYSCKASNPCGIIWQNFSMKVVNFKVKVVEDRYIMIVNRYIIAAVYIGAIFASASFILNALASITWIVQKRKKLMKSQRTINHSTQVSNISSPEPVSSPEVRIEGTGAHWCDSPYYNTASAHEPPLDSHWEFPRDRLILQEEIGAGAFGIVQRAEAFGITVGEKSTTVAVKMVKTDEGKTELMKELEIMKIVCDHRHIISLLGCCTQGGPLYIITEFAPHGNVRDFLQSKRPRIIYDNSTMDLNGPHIQNRPLTESDLISFAHQVARGMEFMESRKCIHRDLAARNILVAEDYFLKIADFGLARNLSQVGHYQKYGAAHLPFKWMAPEALFYGRYTFKNDVWAYGVLLWEIFTLGCNPYPSVLSHDLFDLLQTGYRLAKPQYASAEMYQIMRNCWAQTPALRPTFTNLVQDLDRILTSRAARGVECVDLEPFDEDVLTSSMECQYPSILHTNADNESGINSIRNNLTLI